MRPFTSTISLEEARRRLAAAIRPLARTECVGLADAAGRVVVRDVTSSIDVPPFARSAMDGYAVVAADTASATRRAPVRLRIVERIYSGQPPREPIAPGSCAEIATGAPMPAGADAVVIVEDTTPSTGDGVAILEPASPGQNIGRRGADISAGARVVRAGDVLTPGRVGALAATGCAELEVYGRPRVAILSTGNEVVDPGQTLAPGQIFDVNRFTIAALVAAHGGIPEPHQAVHDSLDALTKALDECADADVIVFSGGSSVGERDLILDVVAARGEMIFHGIAIKPGKPTAFALVNGRPLFGMPGNPASCLSNAHLLLVPFLRATARLPPFQPSIVRVPLAGRIDSPVRRHQIYTVRLHDGSAHPAFKGSGDITSLSQADGYIEIPEDQSVVEEGTVVVVTLF
ncbi:MAG TPA: gephyrin-like molybdotransferase Glp [Gemmatimonadaceae bacterium]|nr:gephyrin-like molybdotransferase Glp [Gemmatimonadaceae bacterium]